MERPVGPIGPSGTVARLAVRFEPGADGAGPSPAELKGALDELLGDLDAVVGPPTAGRPDREVTELVETYRPRQRDLVDLLLSDGEISKVEHERLIDHLAKTPRPSTAPPVGSIPEHASAPAPVAAESNLPPARPVQELLRTYQIASLKQAGAVRARRQISFAEYMALKRHFETAENEGASPGGPR